MNILFLCVGNSARSQIAEGIAIHMFGSKHTIHSAGSSPAGFVHPGAINTLSELDIDISNNKPKSIKDLDTSFIKNLDFVITLCAEEICPVLQTNAKSLHWMHEDPANEKFNEIESKLAFKKVRDNIYNLLKKFMIDNL
jgi:arsenate reductase